MIRYLELQCTDTRIWLAIEAPDDITEEQLNKRVDDVKRKYSLAATPKAVFEFTTALAQSYSDWTISIATGAFLTPVVFSSQKAKSSKTSALNKDGTPRKKVGRKPANQALTPRDVVDTLLERQAARELQKKEG